MQRIWASILKRYLLRNLLQPENFCLFLPIPLLVFPLTDLCLYYNRQYGRCRRRNRKYARLEDLCVKLFFHRWKSFFYYLERLCSLFSHSSTHILFLSKSTIILMGTIYFHSPVKVILYISLNRFRIYVQRVVWTFYRNESLVQ